jgi:hypothetical protein
MVFTVWGLSSSFIQVIPVPGRTVSSAGTKVLFFIWIVVRTFEDGVNVLATVGTAVVTTVVGTGVGTVVGGRVNSVVGTVVGIVVGRVVTAVGAACWVHPVKAIKAIRRMKKPITFFMKSK